MRRQGVKVPIIPVSCGVDLSVYKMDGTASHDSMRLRYGLSTKRAIFLFVGRVDAEKKLDVLIRALKILDRPDLQLAIAGRGANLPVYQALANELGLQDQVHFTGFVPANDLVPLLNSVDFLPCRAKPSC